MNVNINNKLIFLNGFLSSISSLDCLLENLSKYDFKYLSQELDTNVLHLVKQKRIYSFKYMSGFKNFEEDLLIKEKFYSYSESKKIVIKCMHMFLKFDLNLK